MESLSAAYEAVNTDTLDYALRGAWSMWPREAGAIRNQLFDADAILSDISHEISYMEDMSFDEEEYRELEERLDQQSGGQVQEDGGADSGEFRE